MKTVFDPKFELNALEKDSAVWKKLRTYMEKRLEVNRKQNDAALSVEETARLRGKIAAYKELLGIDPAINTTDREAGE